MAEPGAAAVAGAGGHMHVASTADLVIAVAYFLIPLEITVYLIKRRCVLGGSEGGRGGASSRPAARTACID